MLIVYRTADGKVVDNTGTNSAYPLGPPDSLAYVNTDAAGIPRASLALLRLHDIEQATLVEQALTHRVTVDPSTRQLVIGDPYGQPPSPAPAPAPPPVAVTAQPLVDLLAKADLATTIAGLRDAVKTYARAELVARGIDPDQLTSTSEATS